MAISQERKAELYDDLFFYICENTADDEKLYHILRDKLGMTLDEVHEHSITFLDEFYTANIPKEKLRDKITANFEDYRRQWMKWSPEQLVLFSSEISAIRRLAKELPAAVSEDTAIYLLQFKNPLEVVADAWNEQHGLDSANIDMELSHLLWSLTDSCDAVQEYELDPNGQEGSSGPEMEM